MLQNAFVLHFSDGGADAEDCPYRLNHSCTRAFRGASSTIEWLRE